MITPPAEMPPVPTVKVRVSVFPVEPAVAEVGLMKALPPPSPAADMSKLELVGFVSE